MLASIDLQARKACTCCARFGQQVAVPLSVIPWEPNQEQEGQLCGNSLVRDHFVVSLTPFRACFCT